MRSMEKLKCLVEIFNERFSKHDLILTTEDVERGNGIIENGDEGWPLEVSYRFGADADGDYLDYYFSFSCHQGCPDHIRIRSDRRDEQLPIVEPSYSYPSGATEEEKSLREKEYYSSNNRIWGMLCAKGFESSPIRNDKPVLAVYISRRDMDGAWVTNEELTFVWDGDYNAALGAAMWLVDDAVSNLHRHGMTADELLALYRASGPDPFIRYENRSLAQAANPISANFFIYQPIPFNAWGYAETACHKLCGTPLQEPSRSLAGWQGRYDRYDKQRMESQLFLDRKVRILREISIAGHLFPEGSIGTIDMFEQFDLAMHVPVSFKPEPLPILERVFNCLFDSNNHNHIKELQAAIPYDELEFVESDEVYAAELDKTYAEIR